MQLAGKVAVVTGGASGLGRATLERLKKAGAEVATFDLAETSPVGDLHRKVDVTSEEGVEQALAAVTAQFGALHILVSCAGIGVAARTVGRKGPLPLADFRRVIEINLIGTFNVIRLAAAIMQQNQPEEGTGERGVIVNTASIAAFDGQMGQAAYSASKGGIVGMTLPIARDLSNYGIRINAIAPGIFLTPKADGLPPEVLDRLAQGVEFPKRLGQPEEFAALAVHLCENTYMNGEVIRLDGATRAPPR